MRKGWMPTSSKACEENTASLAGVTEGSGANLGISGFWLNREEMNSSDCPGRAWKNNKYEYNHLLEF